MLGGGSWFTLWVKVVASKAMNENQRKHIANSLRIIGLAQFASYAYFAINSSEWA